MLRPLLLLLLLPVSLFAQTTQQKVREYRRANEQQILKEFTTLLAIPNVASDVVNIRKNAAHIFQMMKDRGLNPRLLETASQNSPPAVYGEWNTPGATRTNTNARKLMTSKSGTSKARRRRKCMVTSVAGQIRMPNAEIRKNSKYRNPKLKRRSFPWFHTCPQPNRFWASDFELLSGFGFRISDFS